MTYTRGFTPADYPIIKPWFAGIAPHPSHLKDMGIVATTISGRIDAAVFAYRSIGTGVAFVEWLVLRPELSPRRKLTAGLAAFDRITTELEKQNYGFIRMTFNDQRLARILSKARPRFLLYDGAFYGVFGPESGD